MLKKTDNFPDSDVHIKNQDKFKPANKNKLDIIIFISVFTAGVLILLGFAKILSPNVDVGIGINGEYGVAEDSSSDEENIASGNIDERLKKLKMDDDGKNSENSELFSPELDEKVVLPKQKRKTVGEIEAEINNQKELNSQEQKQEVLADKKENTQVKTPEAKKTETAPLVRVQLPQPQQIVNAKVVVGYYANEKQAEVAKTIIQEAGLGVTPIVKNMNGYYTLQVGAYSSKEKAQQAANNLLKSNFPARVIIE